MSRSWISRVVDPRTMKAHRMRWYARSFSRYDDGWMPREKWMKASHFGWDVRCSCGWESRSGGAIEASIKRDIENHIYDADFHHTHAWNGREWAEVPWREVRFDYDKVRDIGSGFVPV